MLCIRTFASTSGSETLSEDKTPVEELFGMEPKVQKIHREGAKEPKNAREDPQGATGGIDKGEIKKRAKTGFADIEDMQSRIKDAQKPDIRSQRPKPSRESLLSDMQQRGFDRLDMNAEMQGQKFADPQKIAEKYQKDYTQMNPEIARKNYEQSRDSFQKQLAEDATAGRQSYDNSDYARNKYDPEYFRREKGSLPPHVQGRERATGQPLDAGVGTIPMESAVHREKVGYDKLSMSEIDERKQKYAGETAPPPSNANTPRASPPRSNVEENDEKRATNADLERTAFESAAVLKEGIEMATNSIKEGAKKLGEKVIPEGVTEKVKQASTTAFEKVSNAAKYATEQIKEGAKEAVAKGKEQIQKTTDKDTKK